ncbi:MAG: MBL fold metallo-hydrolase [Clostridia bacterium]|nr:MBL fold metallo-hydrolase [Clostridia bacterium]
MKITWLGQAGLLVEAAGKTILIDPYFSDCVGKIDPSKTRKMPAADWLWDIHADVLLFTHDHIDHYDPETAPHFLKQAGPITVLAPENCWNKARQHGGAHNYVLFDAFTEWTEGAVRFEAVPAVHSDPKAIGVLVHCEGKCLYITGDTLYSRKIIEAIPETVHAVFLPINGVGNNMNMLDAARFARDTHAELAVPIHWGMMDTLNPTDFPFEPKYIPEIYQSFEI